MFLEGVRGNLLQRRFLRNKLILQSPTRPDRAPTCLRTVEDACPYRVIVKFGFPSVAVANGLYFSFPCNERYFTIPQPIRSSVHLSKDSRGRLSLQGYSQIRLFVRRRGERSIPFPNFQFSIFPWGKIDGNYVFLFSVMRAPKYFA